MHRLVAGGTRYAIATPHRAATEAGREAYERGGNAVDAALAAAAVLAVVYPHMCSIGGDLFALLRYPTGELLGFNGSGAAPRALTRELVGDSVPSMPLAGPLTVTVPGVVHAWGDLSSAGSRLPFSQLLERAIDCAEAGCPVAGSLDKSLADASDAILRDPGLSSVFVSNGRMLQADDRLRQPRLARTLREIASEGPRTLYGGPTGERLVHGLRRLGCPVELADLAAHRTERVEPITSEWKGWEVSTTPPNSQGYVLLQLLAVLERLDVTPDALGPDAPLLAAVYRLTAGERDHLLADPRKSPGLVADLLSDAHISALAEEAKRTPQSACGRAKGEANSSAPASGDTVAVVAADAEGWAVSLIQSVFHSFGAGILEVETGIVCHNRGACFSLDPDSPNVLEAGKRPLNTLKPLLVQRQGHLALVAGTMGGRAQPQIHAQLLARALRHDLPLEQTLAAPRWVVSSLDEGGPDSVIFAEKSASDLVGPILASTGMEVVTLEDFDEDVGHAQYLRVGPEKRLTAATDPRADGSAAAG